MYGQQRETAESWKGIPASGADNASTAARATTVARAGEIEEETIHRRRVSPRNGGQFEDLSAHVLQLRDGETGRRVRYGFVGQKAVAKCNSQRTVNRVNELEKRRKSLLVNRDHLRAVSDLTRQTSLLVGGPGNLSGPAPARPPSLPRRPGRTPRPRLK